MDTGLEQEGLVVTSDGEEEVIVSGVPIRGITASDNTGNESALGEVVDHDKNKNGDMCSGTAVRGPPGGDATMVQQGLSSGSTVSNPDPGDSGEGSALIWTKKSDELSKRLAKARECEAALWAQLQAHEQRINLEIQEKENAKLETQLPCKEQQCVALDRAQET